MSANPLDSDKLLQLVGQVYDTALRPEAFAQALAGLADMLRAGAGIFMVQERRTGRLVSGSLCRIEASTMAAYERDWLSRDVGFQTLGRMAPGSIATDQDVPANFRSSAIYNEFFRPHGWDHVIGACPVNETSLLGLLAFHRGRREGPYKEAEYALLRRLQPHLARAAVLQRHLLDAAAQRQMTIDALDCLATGVLLLDDEARVILMNRMAREILEANDGLSLGRDGLRAALTRETDELRRLVRAAVATGSAKGTGAGGVVAVYRPSMRRALSVLVSPLRNGERCDWLERPAAVVFVTDPEREVQDPEDLLRALYALTPAEAGVCQQLLLGWDVAEIADRLAVSRSTIRSHLKRLLDKTNTRRQAQLVRLLLSGPVGSVHHGRQGSPRGA